MPVLTLTLTNQISLGGSERAAAK